MVFQHSILLGCMPFVSEVSTIQVLISPRGIPSHLVRPPKERFVLNPIYDLVHWLLERYIYLSQLHFRLLYPQVSSGSRRENSKPRSIYQRRFSLTLQPIIFEPYSSIRLISCLISSGGLFVNDSLSSEFSGSPILKVLATILSLPPPISL